MSGMRMSRCFPAGQEEEQLPYCRAEGRADTFLSARYTEEQHLPLYLLMNYFSEGFHGDTKYTRRRYLAERGQV